jgi:Mce-associated membrane protein
MTERLSRLWGHLSWRGVVVGVLVAGLLVVAADRAMAWQRDRQQVTDEKAASAAATAEVEGLIGISATTSKDDLSKLLDGATAGFRSDLADQADGLRKALVKNKVTATGKVVSSAIVKLEDGRATVIVAAVGTVHNKGTAKAEPRNYRLRVDLQQHGDRWLVSGLEFVA